MTWGPWLAHVLVGGGLAALALLLVWAAATDRG